MSKNKITVHLEPGECCVVIPTVWARHIIGSYELMAMAAKSNEDADAFYTFIGVFKDCVEETAVEFYE
jgi:hypothetical protein